MKLRLIALAGVAALAISSPALAGSETGWYFTIGAGWDQLQDVKITSPSLPGAEDEAPFKVKAKEPSDEDMSTVCVSSYIKQFEVGDKI